MRMLYVAEPTPRAHETLRMLRSLNIDVQDMSPLRDVAAHLRGSGTVDALLCDIESNVNDICSSLKLQGIQLPVIVCGNNAPALLALDRIRNGASDYLNLGEVRHAASGHAAEIEDHDHQLIATDDAMLRVLQTADRVAASDVTVLVSGESGTGKEQICRYLHRRSNRAGGKFVAVNCAAIPDTLIESELFGHEKGSFTGATAQRVGRFEEAAGGTLLLDEITEIDVRFQAKLLRVLQEKRFSRVGSNREMAMTARILATTNRSILEQVERGQFREDLYFRLNLITLIIPPLRKRPMDIIPLSEYFSAHYAAVNGLAAKGFSQAALSALRARNWRGNVRELENTIHRAVLLSDGPMIEACHVAGEEGEPRAASPAPTTMLREPGQPDQPRTMSDMERLLILDTLQHTGGNRTHAARMLGISIRSLRSKLKAYETA